MLHCKATLYTRPGKSWANGMNFGMNYAPGEDRWLDLVIILTEKTKHGPGYVICINTVTV